MTTKTWIGGGNNDASNPADWSPAGVPVAGDSPVINSGVINVSSNVLAGDTLTATPGSTVNISGSSAVDLAVRLNNLQPSPLGVTVGLNAGASVNISDYYVPLTIDATGGTLSSYVFETGMNVNIANGDTLVALDNAVSHGGNLIIAGPGVLDVEGSISDAWGGIAISTAAVTGSGTLIGYGPVAIDTPVGPGVTVNMSYPGDLISLDQPLLFQGVVTETDTNAPSSVRTENISLNGLQATSYTYANGVLSLYEGNTVEDTLKLQTPYGVSVTQGGGHVTVWTGGATPSSGTPVPVTNPVLLDPPSDGASGLTVLDTTTDQMAQPDGTPYLGPVAGLDRAYGDVTPDNLNITASTPNWFIQTGSGEDNITVTSGTNVLNGGTGSNFLVGGSGTDTFFVDDRTATATTWSSIVNFHAGDSATVWGVTPQDFTMGWSIAGAADYTGLTLDAVSTNGQQNFAVTLAGYSTADLNNGRLGVSFGTIAGNTYMLIQGH